MNQPWYIVAAFSSVGLVVGSLFVMAGLWSIGELVHHLLKQIVEILIKLLNFIDSQTPNGTIGVLGFLLLVIGFALQIAGAYFGRAR